ncbi:hypothetical protein MLD38_000287 [Melastoma candidum]|uniref:Uncharacterized protein n=1 Tax=Melastoma candidum TaxID=119954 RepID=A0ACB9S9R0_9MYRT|nr:hypothetical protein MLD38_000287 [Melastoma candidum]
MGCGASTFPRDESGGAGGISYLYLNPLHRDSPWRRKGDRAAAGSNPSSKKLLVAAAVDEDGGDSVGRKSVSVNPASPKDGGGFMKEPPVQTMIENVPALKREVKEERPAGGYRDHEDAKGEGRADGEDDKSHADEGSDIEDGLLLFPRSPSFRYYCIPREDVNNDDDSSSSSLDGMKAHVNTGETAGETDAALTSVESNKSCKDHDDDHGNACPTKLPSNKTSQPTKKSRKSTARRLRVALPKWKPSTGMGPVECCVMQSCRAAQVAS